MRRHRHRHRHRHRVVVVVVAPARPSGCPDAIASRARRAVSTPARRTAYARVDRTPSTARPRAGDAKQRDVYRPY
jgi:hypothetical protein